MIRPTDVIHWHYKVKVAILSFERFEQVEARFEREWSKLVKELKYAKN